MPDEIKNPFDFGTGSIDKDQWLRDIDEGQELFIGSYGPSLNKHRTALLRQAFADLRRRISNGDMLSRTADGLYQFGSALNRDDKHMLEAYERALGFMGDLARRQIKAPAKPEEKKYGTATLLLNWLRYLNPSGKFNEKAYWAEGDDLSRIAEIKKFLEQEKAGLSNFSTFDGYKDRADLEARIKAFIDNPTETNLQRLGFDNKNWITKPAEETETEAKTEKEQVEAQIAAALEAELVKQGRLYLNFNNNRGTTDFNLNVPTYDFNKTLLNYLSGALSNEQLRQAAAFNPNFNPSEARAEQARNYIAQQQLNLNNYFANFATSWRPNYESGQANRNIMQNYLSHLFATYNKGTNQDGTPITDYAYDWKKYFTLIGDNQFLINGSLNRNTGRYAYYVPGQGIKESNILDTSNQYVAQELGYTIPSLKEGGKIEFLQQGGGFDYDAWASTLLDNQPKTESKPKLLSNIQFSNSENARIAAVIADIASMGAAFVPGYGTAASAALGLGSTATNFGADISDGVGLWGATKNAGFGLAADVMGLIPGLGGLGKGAKIARNLMWAVPKMMQWVNTFNGLSNAGEIKNSIVKLTSPSSMTLLDWLNVSLALQIMTGHGRSVATKVKKSGMSKSTTTTEPEYYIFTNKGKLKVSDETFKKLREVKGTKARLELTLELMGDGVTLQLTRFAPWNTSTRVGAFKEVPGKTKIKVNNKHKGWYSDESLIEGAENLNPSMDIRNFLYKINPYRGYYQGRVQKFGHLPLYLERPVQVLPNNFGVTKEGMKNAGFSMEKPKRKPLSAELKQKRAANRTKKKQEAEEKLKLLKTNLLMSSRAAMSEEVPSTDMNHSVSVALALKKLQNLQYLSSPYATRPETPDNFAPQVAAFYNRYKRLPIRHKLGGIIKAQFGLNFDRTTNYKRDKENAEMNMDLGSLYSDKNSAMSYNFGMFPVTFPNYNETVNAGGAKKRGELKPTLGKYMHNGTLDYQSAIDAQNNYFTYDSGKNIMGDVYAYYNEWAAANPTGTYEDFVKHYNENVDALRSRHKEKWQLNENGQPKYPINLEGWEDFNSLHHKMYRSYGKYKDAQGNEKDDWDPSQIKILGESTWRRLPNAFNGSLYENLRRGALKLGDNNSVVYMDVQGHLQLGGDSAGRVNPNNVKESPNVSNEKAIERAGERHDPMGVTTNNPFDPTLLSVAAKTLIGLRGNANIYGNLLREMPQAPLRDPIDRKLAILGWQDQIKQGQNQLADLRNIQLRLQGSDQLTNFATALETEKVGRGIMDDKYIKDAGRQFETALKSWNIDNEDIFYNAKVHDDNVKAILDRARMMAQIRAAWRSGDNNILMGAVADTTNWWLKRYQREQDLLDKAKELALGTPEEKVQSNLYKNDTKYRDLMDKYLRGDTLTDEEKAYVKSVLAKALRSIRGTYALSYYNSFHNPLYGGNFYYGKIPVGKDGTKLEVEKLKARGKDNDRFVSMFKDLRKHSYRRRRR